MIRATVYTAIGFAAGYSLMRAIECRSQGVPLRMAFKLSPRVLLTPVSKLVGLQAASVSYRRIGTAPIEADAVMQPEFAR